MTETGLETRKLGKAGKRLEGLHRPSGIEQVEGLYLAPSEQSSKRDLCA